MSKSTGGFTTVSTLEENNYNPLAYRLFCLQSHYRNPLVFSLERLDAAQNLYKKLISKIATIKQNISGEVESENVKKYKEKFVSALENDINTSLALTTLYDVMKDETINNATKLFLIEDFDNVLSLNLIQGEQTEKLDDSLKEYIETKISERLQAKKEKNYAFADQIRNELDQKGIMLKDSSAGTDWDIKQLY